MAAVEVGGLGSLEAELAGPEGLVWLFEVERSWRWDTVWRVVEGRGPTPEVV